MIHNLCTVKPAFGGYIVTIHYPAATGKPDAAYVFATVTEVTDFFSRNL